MNEATHEALIRDIKKSLRKSGNKVIKVRKKVTEWTVIFFVENEKTKETIRLDVF